MVKIRLKLLGVTEMPLYMTEGAAGFDLASVETVCIQPQKAASVRTGLCAEIPAGYEIQVRPRSGLGFKHNIVALFGTIDSDYRGEIKARLWNFGDQPFFIQAGDRIAQGVLAKVERAEFEEAESLSETVRGTRGYGHTGMGGGSPLYGLKYNGKFYGMKFTSKEECKRYLEIVSGALANLSIAMVEQHEPVSQSY